MGTLARQLANGRRIRDDGSPEAPWTRWLAQCRIPTVTLDGLLPATARLVVVSPHPDDEVLACGGLLAAHAERGGDCVIVAVTDGEASHANSRRWTPRELAETRRAESEEGLRLLGIPSERIVRLGLPDGDVDGSAASLAGELGALLRRGDLVVSTWQLDGHPDHEAAGRVASRASGDAGARYLEAPVWMWHWSGPRDDRVPWHLLRRFVLGNDAARRKLSALFAHATQLTPRDETVGPVLGPLVLERAARDAEYFFVSP